MFDDIEDIDVEEPEDLEPDEAPSNRTFLVVVAILGSIMLISLIALAAYAMVFIPQSRSRRATQAAEANLQNTQVAYAVTQTAGAPMIQPTATSTSTPLINTPTKQITPQETVVFTPTLTPSEATEDPRTATVEALLTQAAQPQLSPTPKPTELPVTGFADNVRAPALLGLALLLIVVIFFVRRVRTSTTR